MTPHTTHTKSPNNWHYFVVVGEGRTVCYRAKGGREVERRREAINKFWNEATEAAKCQKIKASS